MVNIVIVALYIKYRLSPHECSVYPLMSTVKFDWLSRPNGLNLRKRLDRFVQLGRKIIYTKFHKDGT